MFDNLDLSSDFSSESFELEDLPPESDCKEDAKIEKGKKPSEKTGESNTKQTFGLFKIKRPPSRHKLPSKTFGLDSLVTPHTPPKTQKEIDECADYSHTVNLKGIGNLIGNISKEKAVIDSVKQEENNSGSDYESFSSSRFYYN